MSNDADQYFHPPDLPMTSTLHAPLVAPAGMQADDALEKRAYAKVFWRLVPFLMLCYVVAYLDRVNVGFA
jgi:hypothetical protein